MIPTEADEAKQLVAWLRIKGIKFHHSPNETGQSPEARRRAIRMKQQGTSSGYPDYTILIPTVGIIFIELKRLKNSTTSQNQKDWIAAINEVPNCQAFIAKGAEEAIRIVEGYLPTVSNSLVF